MPTVKSIDPSRYAVIFGGNQLVGFAEGSMVKIAREKESSTYAVGGKGDVARIKNLSKVGKVTVTLMKTSPSNDILSTLLLADERGLTIDAGVKALFVEDGNGNTFASCAQAWIEKYPEVDLSSESTNCEWVFCCGQLEFFVGGNEV